MEGLVMEQFGGIYRGRRVLVTGHTGFKGSWLSLWLEKLGAQVTGVALAPASSPNHLELLGLDLEDLRFDIRDSARLAAAVASSRPEIIFHLAAQPLVRESYLNPLETWSTNVMGTANLLEACRLHPGVAAVVLVTTDKVYENHEWYRGYREDDRLGGHDPYSASKAATEILAASYRSAFYRAPDAPLFATARAGNVIGGGDWSKDRLLPDAVRAVTGDLPLEIRSPEATRPWQHVLECLSGYLVLGQFLLEGRRECAQPWNFGPDRDGTRTVREVLDCMGEHWPGLVWRVARGPQPHEAGLLHLDSSKARFLLGWRPVWGLETAVAQTAQWYRAYCHRGEVASPRQLEQYVRDARRAAVPWSGAGEGAAAGDDAREGGEEP